MLRTDEPSANVAAPILEILAADPRRVAVVEPDGRRVTYAGLRRRVVALGLELERRGLAPGERVVLLLPNGVEFAASALAVLLAGGVPVLCEPGLGDAVFLSRVAAARARWLLVHPLVERLGRVPLARRVLRRLELDVPPVPPVAERRCHVRVAPRWLDDLAERLPGGESASFAPAARAPGDDGVLIFTGGTTSAPKGVRLSHAALASYLTNIQAVIEDIPVDRFLADTPQQVLYALRLGRTAFTTRGRRQRRARHVAELVSGGAVDAYFGSPYLWVEMMAQARERARVAGRAGDALEPATLPASLRTVLLGSAPVTPGFLRQLRGWLHPGTRVLAIYGLTEAGPVCVARVEDKLAWEARGLGGDFVGPPLPGVGIDIDPGDDPRLAADDVGEVLVRSPSLFTGYLGDAARPSEAPLHTGDLGRLLPWPEPASPGRALVLAGRAKDMIIRRSVNLYPGTLEPPIRALADPRGPLFGDVALVGLWDEAAQDERVVLCAVPAPGRRRQDPAFAPEALLPRVAVAVGTDGAPDHLLLLDAFPVTGRQNKTDKVALRRHAAQAFGGGARPGLKSAPLGEAATAAPAAVKPASSAAEPGAKAWGDARAQEPPGASPEADFSFLPGVVIPFGWAPFFRKYRALLAARGAPRAVLGEAAFRVALYAAGQAGWAADALLAPGWQDVPMHGPLFVLGHQRSGTTFLQRLLAADRTHARALALHEMILPATSLQRGLGALGEADRALLGGALGRRVAALQERLFGPLDDIHRLRFEEVEEDEFVLWSLFESIMCANDGPASSTLPALDDLRCFDTWPAARQARALGWYRACLLKKLQRTPGADPASPCWIVSKNPAFTHKTAALCRVFPDARFVYLLRSPLETIPSRLSLIRAIWRRRFPGFRELSPAQVEAILEDSVRTYLSAEAARAALPPDRFLELRYEDLRAHPEVAVRRIYDALALPGGGPDPFLRAALAAAEARARARPHRSAHRYDLAEFGLDEARLRALLAPVFARVSFG